MTSNIEWKVDRTGWPRGPWDGEPDKVQFRTEAGFPGLVVRNRLGGLCGYVGVPKEHALHGVHYGDVDGRFDVHGGLTYSESCAGHICHVPEPGEPDDVWWFGFDCVHCYDLAPSMLRYGHCAGDEYRDLAYVRGEVESLARQLAGAAS